MYLIQKRDPEFVAKYYDFMTPYLKKKADEMKEKWHSSSCYVKRIPDELNDNLEEWKKCLFSLKPIKKGEHVASFLNDDEIDETKHLLCDSLKANCQLIGREVFAKDDIKPESELSLYYHGILL